MNLATVTLEHGERYGRLTVLRRVKKNRPGNRYKCGCSCGSKDTIASATALMSGRVKSCARCATNAKGRVLHHFHSAA